MQNGTSSPILLEELKKILKQKKIRYHHLSEAMNMSESSIKRLMSSEDISISKIEGLCSIAGINFFDLVILCKEKKYLQHELTKQQEEFFGKNTSYFYFFHLIYEEKLSISKVKDLYQLNESSIHKYLSKFEQLGLLELHPYNKIKWLIQGPISISNRFSSLSEHIMSKSLDNLKRSILDKKYNFKDKKDKPTFAMVDYYLKKETAQAFQERIKNFLNEITQTSQREIKVYDHSELQRYCSILGIFPTSLYNEDIPNL